MPTWTDVSGTSQTLAANQGYTADNGALVTFTLPASAAVGDMYVITGRGAGGWKVAQLSGQQIHFGALATTSGTGGSLASTGQYDSVGIVCTVANVEFNVVESIGQIEVT